MAYTNKNLDIAINKLQTEFKANKTYIKANKEELVNLVGISNSLFVKLILPIKSLVDMDATEITSKTEDLFNYADTSLLFKYLKDNTEDTSRSCYSTYFKTTCTDYVDIDKTLFLADILSPLTKKVSSTLVAEDSIVYLGTDRNIYSISNLGIKSINLDTFNIIFDDSVYSGYISVNSLKSIIRLLRLNSSTTNQVKWVTIKKGKATYFNINTPKGSISVKHIKPSDVAIKLPPFIEEYKTKELDLSIELRSFVCSCLSDTYIETEVKENSVDDLLTISITKTKDTENELQVVLAVKIKFSKANVDTLNLKFLAPNCSPSVVYTDIHINHKDIARVIKDAISPFKKDTLNTDSYFLLNYIENCTYIELVQITKDVKIQKTYIPIYFDPVSLDS